MYLNLNEKRKKEREKGRKKEKKEKKIEREKEWRAIVQICVLWFCQIFYHIEEMTCVQ